MPVTEEQLKEALNAFGDFQHQREYLKAQKQELINKVIPPEVQIELEAIEAELKSLEKRNVFGQILQTRNNIKPVCFK